MAIKMTTDQLQSLASALKNLSEQSVQLGNDVQGKIREAVDNWEGAARNRYENDWEAIKPTLMTKLPNTLMTMAENLSTMAKDFADLDAKHGQG